MPIQGGTVADSEEMARKIEQVGKQLDYEQMALDAEVRSWRHDDKVCMGLALQDGQLFATLHLARVIERALEARS
jgi:hypothetical protein